MIRVINILAGISPANVNFTRSQVYHHGADRLFAVERIQAFDIVITDRIRHVDVVFLNGLQALDIMLLALADQP